VHRRRGASAELRIIPAEWRAGRDDFAKLHVRRNAREAEGDFRHLVAEHGTEFAVDFQIGLKSLHRSDIAR